MSRINTNVNALMGARILAKNNSDMSKTLEKLSTGYRINRGADDPAGMIASGILRAEKGALKAAVGNAQRASSMVATAEGALQEVQDRLTKLQELVAQAANSGGFSQDEIAANQEQVDGIVDAINRVASETAFQGRKLIDGSLDFAYTNAAAAATDVVIKEAKLGSATSMTATIAIADSADTASANTLAADVSADTVVEVTGNLGTQVFTFANGTTQAEVAAAINAVKDSTGVSATTTAVNSTDYGSSAFVRVKVLSGGGGFTDSNVTGTDATVTVNGLAATVKDYDVTLKTNSLNMSFKLKKGAAAADGGAITITGGGAEFMLSPIIGMSGQSVIGIQSVGSQNLGSTANGFLREITSGQAKDLTNDPQTAVKIVNDSIKQVAKLRGRLGSFVADICDSSINAFNIAYENVSAAEAVISETDFATATAELTRNQILVNAATSVLTMATSAPQAVLGLLG